MIPDCTNQSHFASVAQLKRHLEQNHKRTFCEICLQGRLVFLREQRLYPLNKLRSHIEYGDPSSEKHAEILPHPYCDFSEKFVYDADALYRQLQRNHNTCHLCGERYKYTYYEDYESLEKHFEQSHYSCPYDYCKKKCFVVFKTAEEL